MNEKQCSKCKIIKQASEFSVNRSVKTGLYSRCRTCTKGETANKSRAKKDKENYRRKELRKLSGSEGSRNRKASQRSWYLRNRDRAIAKAMKHTYANYDKHLEAQRRYSNNNKEKRRQYLIANKEKLNTTNRIRERHRYNIDQNFKIRKSLRNRLNKAMRIRYRVASAVRDLGCSIEELKVYLESKFQSGMTWDNWGLCGWHIDHIVPLKSFDLTDREQLLKACHYTNLQPLWAKDNLRKGYQVESSKEE